MQYVPQARASREVIRIYKEICRTTVALARWIRAQGWRARAYCDPGSTDLLQIPLAVNAGLGELGKHGSLICREFGSNVRLGTVVTDMPLTYDAAVDIGVEDMCRHCQRCTLDCPPQAISDSKQWVRGDHKWYVDFDRCVPYFSITGGCAICIQVCPFSEDGRGPKLSEQLLRRRATRASAVATPVSA
jgi:epoxyqueuosine reductase QueG